MQDDDSFLLCGPDAISFGSIKRTPYLLDWASSLPRSDHLWHDKNGSWSVYHLTKVLKAETAMGQEFTTSGYRHVAVEMRQKYVGEDFVRD
jgi:hypothetical protein